MTEQKVLAGEEQARSAAGPGAPGKAPLKPLPEDALFERLAHEQLHRDEVPAFVFVDVVDNTDVRMIQGRSRLSFSLEPLQRLAVPGQRFWEELQGNRALEPGVLGLVDHPHTALAQLFDDLIAAGKG